MPANKNHHYVPQMYMRLFAHPGDNRIGVFVLDKAKFIPKAPIGGQASRDYFYGKNPALEKALGRLESCMSKIFSDAVNHYRLPLLGSYDHEFLVLYLAMQHARTVRSEEEFIESVEKRVKAIARHKADLEDNLDISSKIKDLRIKGSKVVSDVVFYSAAAYKLMMDLDIVLIKNESNTRFISSDAPLVLHNRLYEGQDISCIGYANVGLQLFLPLGPQLAIFGFDRGAYKVESSESGLVKVNDDEQIFLINDLQWEAAHSVLLVSPDTPEQVLQESANIWSSRRGAERTVSREEIVYRTENEAKMRYGSGAAPSKVALNLPFVTCTLPKPARLGPWEVPPLRDASRASLLFES